MARGPQGGVGVPSLIAFLLHTTPLWMEAYGYASYFLNSAPFSSQLAGK